MQRRFSDAPSCSGPAAVLLPGSSAPGSVRSMKRAAPEARCLTLLPAGPPSSALRPVRAGYIGEFEIIDDHRSGKIVVELIGRINKCGVISPRYDVQVGDIEQWVVNLLPSRQFGKIILTTSMGIMDHDEARRRGTGGKIIGFFY